MTSIADPDRHFARQHERLEAQLQAHLLAVIGGDLARADAEFTHWRAELSAHIATEERALLPHLPQDARWPAKVYVAEHERITLLADEYAARFAQVRAVPPEGEHERCRAALWLIDAAHALRHVLDHHHQREHHALALELPQDLQARVWGGHD